MYLRLRVTLEGIKAFYRLYELNAKMSLFDLHTLLSEDLELVKDQVILFKAMLGNGQVYARYSFKDLGAGTVDNISLEDCIHNQVVLLYYYYNTADKKYLLLNIEELVEKNPNLHYPTLLDSKGPNPEDFENGYVSIEDMPKEQREADFDEEDEDIDEEESSDLEDFNEDIDNLFNDPDAAQAFQDDNEI